MGYYTIEVYAGDKLNGNSYILQNLKDVERQKDNGFSIIPMEKNTLWKML
jgi:hypothetical protein